MFFGGGQTRVSSVVICSITSGTEKSRSEQWRQPGGGAHLLRVVRHAVGAPPGWHEAFETVQNPFHVGGHLAAPLMAAPKNLWSLLYTVVYRGHNFNCGICLPHTYKTGVTKIYTLICQKYVIFSSN